MIPVHATLEVCANSIGTQIKKGFSAWVVGKACSLQLGPCLSLSLISSAFRYLRMLLHPVLHFFIYRIYEKFFFYNDSLEKKNLAMGQWRESRDANTNGGYMF